MILSLLNSVIPGWQEEHRFDPERQWRADFAHLDRKIIIEIEGGAWTNGRHVRGKGYLNDCAKYNVATIQGWRVLRYGTSSEQLGKMLADVELLISANNEQKPTCNGIIRNSE